MFDVIAYKVSVDGDRGRGPRPGRGDDLEAGIHDIACRPDSGSAGSAGAIDDRKAGIVDIAAQAGQKAVGMRDVDRPDEHRCSRDHATIDQFDTAQCVSIDHEPCDLTVHDLDAASLQLLKRVEAQVESVGEEDNVVRPLTDQQRVLDGIGSAAKHGDGLVTDFPAVAIRTVQQVLAPSFANAWEVRQLVTNPGRYEDPSRLQDSAFGKLGGKPWLEADDLAFDQLDAVSADLGASRGQKVGWRHPISG